jgi:uncharacterized protein YndB with AHSA1/START domain
MPSTVLHDTFVLEREYPVDPDRVFAAFADLETKQRWFGGPDDWTSDGEHTLDFRVGGHEHEAGGPPGGWVSTFDATYLDIVRDERIIYSYSMTIDGVPLSVSLATIEIASASGGSRLRITEHGAYFDTAVGPAQRVEGTEHLLDAIGAMFAADLAATNGTGAA